MRHLVNVPAIILGRVTPKAYALFSAFCVHADKVGKVTCSLDQARHIVGMAANSADRAMAELIKGGWILSKRRAGGMPAVRYLKGFIVTEKVTKPKLICLGDTPKMGAL